MHPRVLVDGFEIAKRATLEFLEKFKTPVVMGDVPDKETLKMVARTTLRTKVLLFFFSYFTRNIFNFWKNRGTFFFAPLYIFSSFFNFFIFLLHSCVKRWQIS